VKLGTFIKTPSPHVVEILGLSGLDFGLIDAEHGPFDRSTTDVMMVAGRAAGLPLLVRTPNKAPDSFLWALDLGAAGVVVPHVDTEEQARAVVAACRYKGGERGFSNSPRFGRYGATTMAEAIAIGDVAEVHCQIESQQAVANAAAIAAVPGVASLVIGRADLALSMGLDRADHPDVLAATEAAIRAARAAGKDAVIVTGGAAELPPFARMGATLAVVGSDQALMRVGAKQMVETVASHAASLAQS
jgi:2-keto-3-deoxy-L-rhamnonate aldolase RhmA